MVISYPVLYQRILWKHAISCQRLLPSHAQNVMTIQDMISEGLLVLVKAVKCYDGSHGASFRTFFTRLLMNHFQKIVRDTWAVKRNFESVSYDERLHGSVDNDILLALKLREEVKKILGNREGGSGSMEKSTYVVKSKYGLLYDAPARKYLGKVVELEDGSFGVVVKIIRDGIDNNYTSANEPAHLWVQVARRCIRNGESVMTIENIPLSRVYLTRRSVREYESDNFYREWLKNKVISEKVPELVDKVKNKEV